MKRTLPAKIAVVCSSLILGCTYVSSQNNGHKETPALQARPTSQSRPAEKPSPAVTVNQRTVLPSSKSIDRILSAPGGDKTSQDNIQPTPAEPASKTVMPSSKSAPIFRQEQKDPFKNE